MCVCMCIRILSVHQLVPAVLALCHLSAPIEWVTYSKEFKSIYNQPSPGEEFFPAPQRELGDVVLRSFMRNPEFLGAGYFYTDPKKMYFRGRRCSYADDVAARAHLRVGAV